LLINALEIVFQNDCSDDCFGSETVEKRSVAVRGVLHALYGNYTDAWSPHQHSTPRC